MHVLAHLLLVFDNVSSQYGGYPNSNPYEQASGPASYFLQAPAAMTVRGTANPVSSPFRGDVMSSSSPLHGSSSKGNEHVLLQSEGLDWLFDVLQDPSARFLLLQDGNMLLEEDSPVRPVWLSAHDLSGRRLTIRAAVDLGADEQGPRVALDLPEPAMTVGVLSALSGTFQNLSGIQESVPPLTWRVLARARALLAWNLRTTACPSCGAATASHERGMVRVCTSPDCAHSHFPRTDPTVIVRVVSGDRCLLARQPRFRAGLRSVLAGFVEPGETLEEAVCREVAEEVGIDVDRIEYLGSQPWPFPMNLMIAFQAHARDDAICLDNDELESADWYTRERARQELADGSLILPSEKSIARWMIEDWLEDRREAPRTAQERLARPN